MSLDIQSIIDQMTSSFRASLSDMWEEAGKFALSESKKFAENTREITEWYIGGEIDEDMARSLMQLHAESMRGVLTASAGISLALAEKAIKDAISSIKDIANSAIGFDLL